MTLNTITVQELIDKLQKIKDKNIGVYMLTDRSEKNYDENGYPVKVHPIEFVEKEKRNIDDGWENDTEVNIILETPEEC